MFKLTSRNRMLGGAALATALILSITGCGRSDSGSGDDAAGTTVDEAPATGTVEVWAQGADGAELPEMFKRFQADNPDVELNLTQVPDEEFASKMTAAITAGTVPDLIYAFTETQGTLLKTGGFDPVPDGLVDEGDFFPSIWNNSVIDEVQYGVPWYSYASFFLYRSDLTEAAGAEVPTDWDGLTEWGKKMKASGVEFPLRMSGIPNYNVYTAIELGVFAQQNGGSLISDDLSTWTINDPKNVEALEYWGSIFKDGLASPDGPAFLDAVPWVSQGRAAAIHDGGPWFAPWFDDANGEGWGAEHLGYALNPAGPAGPGGVAGGGSWFVPTDGENKDAAWKFARYMAEPESQVAWYEVFGNLPAVEAAWDDPALQGSEMLDVVREAIDDGYMAPKVSTWNEVGDVIGKEMERVARGQGTAQEALDAAQKQAEAIGTGD